jgi:hypothetical protein
MEYNKMSNFIQISRCGKFLMSETKVYSVDDNMSYNIKDLGIDFWLFLCKENTIKIVEQNVKMLPKINKFINEVAFKFSEIFNDYKIILEFHRINKGSLILTEGYSTDTYKTILENSWSFFNNYLIKNNYINEEDSWLSKAWDKTKEVAGKAWDKTKEVAGKAVQKVKSAVSWIKEKGVSWFFESLRAALFSWGGAAVQVFLASAGSLAFGLGPTINFITWAAMLCYDVYLGISKGDWNWVYIIIDILGTFTAGPGAKIAHGIFKAAGLLGRGVGGSLTNIIKKLGTTSGGQKLSGMFKNVVSGLSTLLGYVTKAITWIGEKLGLKVIVNAATSIKNWISKIVGEASAAFGASSVGKAATAGVNTLKSAAKGIKTGYTGLSKGAKTAVTAGALGGLTYGINKYSGADTSIFSSAFSKDFKTPEQKQAEDMVQAASLGNAEFSDEDLPS